MQSLRAFDFNLLKRIEELYIKADYVFKATLKNIGLLTDSVSTIAELIDEGIFKLSKEGISLIASDRAMVAVVDFKLSASAFEEFVIDKEQSIGLDIPNFLSVLKRGGSEDRATFSLQDSKLELMLENASRRRFVLPLLDLSQEEIPAINQLEFSTKVQVKSDVLQSGIEDAGVVADSVLFVATPSRFGMKADGDVSSTQLELEKGTKSLIDLMAAKEAKARYPLDYLKKMVKAAKLADSVTLEWSQDYPIKISFRSGDKVSLSFVLAPRVQEE